VIYSRITERLPIEKGWSGERKYRAVDSRGERYLLRLSPPERLERKRMEYEYMTRAAKLGVAMCVPLETGECGEGVYSIHTWIDGADAEEAIPALPEAQQYRLGRDAGVMLRLLHTIPAPAQTESWAQSFGRKIDRKIAMYAECPLSYEKGQVFLECIERSRHLIAHRPLSFQHGDYHIGNMMLGSDGRLYVIDFDRFDFGDPWEEFNRIAFSARRSQLFATGIMDGYFPEGVPEEFWRLLALYLSSNTLSSLPWAIPYGEEQIAFMQAQAEEILGWYDDMKSIVPSWYRSDARLSDDRTN